MTAVAVATHIHILKKGDKVAQEFAKLLEKTNEQLTASLDREVALEAKLTEQDTKIEQLITKNMQKNPC